MTSEIQQVKDSIQKMWLIIWLGFFMAIVAGSLLAPNSVVTTLAKLGGVMVCLLYTVVTFPKDYLLVVAMIFTCVADLILAVNNIEPAGVGVFLGAQLVHFAHLTWPRGRKFLMIYSGAAAVCLLVNAIWGWVPMLYAVVGFYAGMLVTNLVVSFTWRHREPGNIKAFLAKAGFSLFLCCDICTGLSYLALTGVLPADVYMPINVAVWIFYYVSQILLANTGKYDIMEKRKVIN